MGPSSFVPTYHARQGESQNSREIYSQPRHACNDYVTCVGCGGAGGGGCCGLNILESSRKAQDDWEGE